MASHDRKKDLMTKLLLTEVSEERDGDIDKPDKEGRLVSDLEVKINCARVLTGCIATG